MKRALGLGLMLASAVLSLSPTKSWGAQTGERNASGSGSGLQAHCLSCGDHSPMGLKRENEISLLRSRIAREFSPKNIPGLRDMDEVREFIQKKHDGQKDLDKVLRGFDRTREDLEFAALAFELPPAFLACLTYQESKFNSGAVSSAGAKGMLQLNTDGKREVLNILKNGQTERGPASHGQLHDNWTNFHRLRLAENKPSEKKMISLTTDPRHLTGVAGGSVLLSFYLDRMKTDRKPLNRYDVLNAAGAYNMGITRAVRLCNDLSSRACTEKLAHDKSETRAQINSIDECMSRHPTPIR